MKHLWKRTRWPVAVLLAYLIGRLLLPLASPGHGLLTPDGQLHLPSAVATASVLLLRLSALFVAAPLIVYRFASVLIQSRDGEESARPAEPGHGHGRRHR